MLEMGGGGGRSQNQQVRHLGQRLQSWRIHDRDVTKGKEERKFSQRVE